MSRFFIEIVIIMCAYCNAYGQEQYFEKKMKVLNIQEFDNGYLLAGLDLINNDTIYFISLKEKPCKKQSENIKVGNEYKFEIEDIDYVKGSLPAALPNGYYIKRGKINVKREGRNGKTYTTTQYVSKNTNGQFMLENKE